MPLEKIILNLEELVSLHKSLNEIARKKTEVIVNGDFESLQTILKDENKHIQIIQKQNVAVLKVGKDYLLSSGVSVESPTLSAVMEHADEKNKDLLNQLKSHLEEQVLLLQQQNSSNQELLEQSLHYINLSLDLLIPDVDSFNYSPSKHDEQKESHSIFDSKA